jgi:hypothetical protein
MPFAAPVIYCKNEWFWVESETNLLISDIDFLFYFIIPKFGRTVKNYGRMLPGPAAITLSYVSA